MVVAATLAQLACKTGVTCLYGIDDLLASKANLIAHSLYGTLHAAYSSLDAIDITVQSRCQLTDGIAVALYSTHQKLTLCRACYRTTTVTTEQTVAVPSIKEEKEDYPNPVSVCTETASIVHHRKQCVRVKATATGSRVREHESLYITHDIDF